MEWNAAFAGKSNKIANCAGILKIYIPLFFLTKKVEQKSQADFDAEHFLG
jgi:hypothetical protein